MRWLLVLSQVLLLLWQPMLWQAANTPPLSLRCWSDGNAPVVAVNGRRPTPVFTPDTFNGTLPNRELHHALNDSGKD